MLATITALVSVRLEGANDASVALTERFIEVMEAEHREMGLSDPKLGRTVRKLVGALARRVDLWRTAVGGEDWNGAVRASLYGDGEPPDEDIEHSSEGLRILWTQLEEACDSAVAGGQVE